MSRALRIAVAVLLGAFQVACFLISIATWDVETAEFGWNSGTDGSTIINVEPDLPAARAGVQAGDRIVYRTMPVLGRLNLLLAEYVYPGATLTFSLEHGGTTRTVTMTAEEFPSLYDAVQVLYAFGGLALGLVALGLLLLRPSLMTWGCAFIATPFVLPELFVLWAQRHPATGFLWYAFVAVLYGLQAWGLLVFASRFPTNATRGIARWIDRLAIPVGLATGGVYGYIAVAIYWLDAPPHWWTLVAEDYGTTAAAAICALIALASNFAISNKAERSRLTPVIVSFVLLILTQTLQQFVAQLSSNVIFYALTNGAFALSALLVAAAVAYGVVRHRVIDVDFIISRTLVYTILTVVVVAFFALIEYFIGKLLEAKRLAEIIEVAAAVGIGVSLNYVHAWLDRLLDVVFFRRRHQAEVRLEQAARTLQHASSEKLVGELLVDEPVEALELASAAVFRADGERFVREKSVGWDAAQATALTEDDVLVARLRADLRPVELAEVRWPRADLPAGNQQPLLAVPVAIGHRLEGVVLYGAHVSGEALDPDERRSLRNLAASAALAYDHLIAEELQRRLEAVQTENESLRRVEEKLSALLEERMRPGP